MFRWMSRAGLVIAGTLGVTLSLLLAAVALAPPVRAERQASVPFKASFSAQETAVVDPLRCPVLTIEISGLGLASHLGRLIDSQSHCIDPGGSDPLAFTGGHYTFTSANGDSIFGDYSGHLVPTGTAGVFTLDGAFTITGGTGRFQESNGGGSAGGVLNLNTGQANVSLAGVIAAVGSTAH